MSKKRVTLPITGAFEEALNKYVDGRMLADHPELLPGLFNRLGLDAYLNYFLESTAKEVPGHYHGKDHTFQVALNAYEGALYSGFSNKEVRTILVAALFHDAEHSCGQYSDVYNISLATQALKRCHKATPVHQQLKEDELQEALTAIQLTEFPYKVKKTNNAIGKVLRDADVMTIYTADPDLLVDLLKGLWQEQILLAERTKFDYKGMTLAQFIEGQKKFVLTFEWQSSWGKIKAFKRNWPQAGRRANQLLELSDKGW